MKRTLFAGLAVAWAGAVHAGAFNNLRFDSTLVYPADGLTAGAYACVAGETSRMDLPTEREAVVECRARTQPTVDTINARRAQLTQHPEDAGCLGKDAVTCLATLSQGLVVSNRPEDRSELQLLHPAEHDIQGKTVPETQMFYVYVPAARVADEPVMVALALKDGQHVDQVFFALHNNPLVARTQEDWDQTGVYEFANAAMGLSCSGSDRLVFYRSYDKLLKNAHMSKSLDPSYANPGVSTSLMSESQGCGGTMEVGDVEGINVEQGSYGGGHLAFSLPDATPPSLKAPRK